MANSDAVHLLHETALVGQGQILYGHLASSSCDICSILTFYKVTEWRTEPTTEKSMDLCYRSILLLIEQNPSTHWNHSFLSAVARVEASENFV